MRAAAARLLLQAREVSDGELERLCARVCSRLRGGDPGPDAVDGLCRLFLIVFATKYPRKLPPSCLDQLWATLGPASRPEQLQVLCAAVLRELCPSGRLSLPCDHALDPRQLSLVASVLLAQGARQDKLRAVLQRVFKVLESRQLDVPSPRPLLPLVSRLVGLAPGCLQEDQADLLSKRLADWLRYASVQRGAPHPSGSFFGPRARQPDPVTELDGALAADFFTVLTAGRRLTEDQWLSVQAFSSLRRWLLLCGPGGPCDTDDRSEPGGSSVSVLSASSTGLRGPRERLREKAFEYCQRLLEQSGRRALRKADAELQRASLAEAVLVLDVLCTQDPSFLYRSLSCLKGLPARLCADPAWTRALLPLAQFLLRHGEAAAADSEALCQHLLGRVPAALFPCPLLGLELLGFCRDNAHLLGRALPGSFPNLLKLLAWDSPALTPEFVALLPALVDPATAPEMLQALLDLPCLTAALDLQLRSQPAVPERPQWDVSLRVPGCLDAFRDPQLQGLFAHLLRNRAGESPQRLTPLFRPLQPMASCARVVQCAQAVPTLLRAFFSAVTPLTDATLAHQLALLLLERTDALFHVPGYQTAVHRVLGQQLQSLCQLHPPLALELERELLDFLGSSSDLGGHSAMVTNVVWVLGEFLSTSCDRRCSAELIGRVFEALEALLFEVTQARPPAAPRCPSQVVTALMTTLTKLASRSQDLIPRVSLFLSKMRGPALGGAADEEAGIVHTRASELLRLLKMPSVAQLALTPGPEAARPRFHRDVNTALPLALATVRRLLDREAGLVPG